MRVLATSTPGMGHLNAIAPLLKALQEAGHEVLVVTATESCDLVEQYGFAVRPGGMAAAERAERFAPTLPDVMALPPRQRRAMFFAGLFGEHAAAVMHRDLRGAFDDFRPDVVIHETAELAAAPMAASCGIPHATVAFSGTLPAGAWARTLAAVTPIWVAEGLTEPAVDDLVGAVYLHPFPPSFGQAPDVPSVGRMRAMGFDSGAVGAASWIDALGGGRPIVYLTSGTEPAAATAPWAAAVEAIGDRDVQAIVTIGNRLDPTVLGAIPANVRVERFVPQRLILDRASVVMSHAGAGSLLGAAERGLPQLLSPLRADQWENADAATAAGVAITCEMDQRTAAQIGAALDRLLHEPTFREAAAHVAAEIAAMPSPADHVATIEALASA